MRIATLIAVLSLALTAVAYADTPPTANALADKIYMQPGEQVGGDRVGGEDIGSAVAIGSLPFTDTGNTCQFVNDYDEVCPYTGSLSPDVVYSLTTSAMICVNIDLCDSYYDTKLYVYDGDMNLVACNDDFCSGPNYPYSYLSALNGLMLGAGTYYIVVDGYGSDCGEYVIHVNPVDCPEVCDVACQAGDVLEGEPDCYDGYNDAFNGGCNSVPAVWSVLEPTCLPGDIWVCGTSGTYMMGASSYRDTDWFEMVLTETSTITYTACGDFPLLIFLIDLNAGCAGLVIIDSATADPMQWASLSYTLSPGVYNLWIGPSIFGSGAPCPAAYRFHVEGFTTGEPSATEQASWGTLKNLYR